MVWLGGSRNYASESAALFSGHYLDVMWQGCSGRKLSETSSIKNEDPAALKSKILQGLFAYGFNIRAEIAMHVLYERLGFLKSTTITLVAELIENFKCLRFLKK